MSTASEKVVLLVDDDESLLSIVPANLQREYHGAVFMTAGSAVQALEIMKNNPVDLLITDIYMPEMDGFDLILSAKEIQPTIKVIVMTGRSSPAITEEVKKMGSVGYIEKPFSTQSMVSLIHDALPHPRSNFDGAIEGIQATDIIQINCISRLSNAVFISNNDQQGAVYFENGEIVHAETDGIEGEEALRVILSWQSGSFSTARSAHSPKQTISKKWEQLLLESLVSIDESQRGDPVLEGKASADAGGGPAAGGDGAVRVLVVDDSRIITKGITDILSSDGGVAVVGQAENGKEALEKVARLRPDVVTMDVHMPEMDGLTALKHIMILQPTPVVMLSAYTQEGAAATFDSLRFGAVDFIAKPSTRQDMSLDRQKKGIVETVKRAARVRISSLQHIRLRQRGGQATPDNKKPNAESVVAMGAALGGYGVLLRVIPQFTEDVPAAFLIVQYMPEEVVETFCRYLSAYSSIPVRPARDDEVIKNGVCYLCSGNRYMTILREGGPNAIRVNNRPFDFDHRNSFNMLLMSVAEGFGKRAVGVVLTGEGTDGLEGAQELKRVGGKIIVQETETCLSSEMPGQVIGKGLADKIVPDHLLVREITRALGM